MKPSRDLFSFVFESDLERAGMRETRRSFLVECAGEDVHCSPAADRFRSTNASSFRQVSGPKEPS